MRNRSPKISLVKVRWFGILLLMTFPTGLSAAEPAQTLSIFFPSGLRIVAEIADTASRRRLGLMHRDALPPHRGMLLIYAREGNHGIWMKNCRFPLDILWLDSRHRVVHAEKGLPPCPRDPCKVYRPPQKARYILEVNAGLLEHEGIRTGQHLRFAPTEREQSGPGNGHGETGRIPAD